MHFCIGFLTFRHFYVNSCMQHSDVQIEGQLLLYNFIVYAISKIISCPERSGRMKCVTPVRREKWLAEIVNDVQICSTHFATGKPSYF